MPDRVAYAGTAQDGDAYTAANHDRMPGGWIGYARVTADDGPVSGDEALTGLSVTVDVGADRLIKISAVANVEYAPNVVTPLVGRGFLSIKEGSTYLGGADWHAPNQSVQASLTPFVILDGPSEGEHTYHLSLWNISGGGAFTLKAQSTLPACILVEDLGPAS